ncbi:hypothetical protein SNL152K_1567 [Streptomyces sp. NL15-2K]|nr:hypothetical protein SNL152K_1567 [Streptomyces sp. NL15-2K]
MHGDVHAGHHLTVPVPHRGGDRPEPLLQFLVDEGVALPSYAVQFRAQGVRRDEGARGQRCQLGAGEPGLDLVVRQVGEDDPAHGRDVRREAGADRDGRGHDAAGRDAGGVHDGVAVQDAQRRRLPYLRDELLQMRCGDLRQRDTGQVGVAELQHARGEAEEPAVGLHVAEVGEGEQEAASGRPGQVAGAGDLAQRQRRVVGVEGADDGEAALEGPDEVRCANLSGHRRLQQDVRTYAGRTL